MARSYVIAVVFVCLPVAGNALHPGYLKSWDRELCGVLDANVRYRWGGAETPDGGMDCSGLMYFTARRAGMPVMRTTSRRMSLGLDGWTSVVRRRSEAEHGDLLFYTLSEGRPFGHVGRAMQSPRTGYPAVVHASRRRGVVADDLIGWAVDFRLVRRLRLGDRKDWTDGRD